MTRRLMPLFVLLSALIAARCAEAAPELTPEQRAQIFGKPGSVSVKKHVGRIPLEGTDHRGFYKCSYMRATINGHGPFTFLFDTGGSFTVVSSKVIEAAHIPVVVERGGHHDLVRIDHMKLGDVEIRNLVAVRDDDFGVDGVLGFRAFGDMNLTFELHDRRLLVSPEPVPLPGGFEVPYQIPHNIPVIPVMVDTAQIATLIDTGDDAYAWEVRTGDLEEATLAHPPSPAEQVLNGARSSQTFVTTLESTVRLGPLTIEHAVVGINDALPVPDFGVDFLADFDFEFDPRRMIVTFQPRTPASGTRITGNLGVGFTMRFDGLGTVQNVVPGSAAEQRGMHAGDRILSIDGHPIAACVPRTWDQALSARKPLTIRWLQDSKERADEFEVTELR